MCEVMCGIARVWVDECEWQREDFLLVPSACIPKQGEICDKQFLLTQDGIKNIYVQSF